MSILILLPVAWAASFASENTVWIVSAFTPFLALLLIAESTKSAIYGMNELEMSARFSLKSVVLARLIILGVFNFGIFCIIIPVCHVANSISFMQTGVYLFVPYLLTTSISLYLVRRFRNKEVIYGCMAVAVFVSRGKYDASLYGRLFIPDKLLGMVDSSSFIPVWNYCKRILPYIQKKRRDLYGTLH